MPSPKKASSCSIPRTCLVARLVFFPIGGKSERERYVDRCVQWRAVIWIIGTISEKYCSVRNGILPAHEPITKARPMAHHSARVLATPTRCPSAITVNFATSRFKTLPWQGRGIYRAQGTREIDAYTTSRSRVSRNYSWYIPFKAQHIARRT